MSGQISILGPGLLGASLAKAARSRRLADRIHVWARRPEARQACLDAGWCDAAEAEPAAAVGGSDFVVVCTPVDRIVPTLESAREGLLPGAVVTDVGSTKARICREAVALLPPEVHFVGSHPMAGSEKTGMENAREDLFLDRACLVTPLPPTEGRIQERVVAFWRGLGMRVHCLAPEEHDRVVANISHLPHMLASVLCARLSENPPDWKLLAGAGLLDTTRVAAGSPDLWTSICQHNRDALLEALRLYRDRLEDLQALLATEDWKGLRSVLEEAREYRRSLS